MAPPARNSPQPPTVITPTFLPPFPSSCLRVDTMGRKQKPRIAITVDASYIEVSGQLPFEQSFLDDVVFGCDRHSVMKAAHARRVRWTSLKRPVATADMVVRWLTSIGCRVSVSGKALRHSECGFGFQWSQWQEMSRSPATSVRRCPKCNTSTSVRNVHVWCCYHPGCNCRKVH